MITLRRKLLDECLRLAALDLKGHVLDVGGVKNAKRGGFRPPLDRVASWRYLNPNPATEPDYCAPADAIPLPDASLDAVVMTEVLEYLPEPGRVLGEIARVLAPGGLCLFSAPYLVAIHGDPDLDRQRFTAVKLRELSAAAGFRVESIEEMGGLGTVLHDLVHVAFGYAHPRYPRIRRAPYLFLRLLQPAFRWLDARTRPQRRYLHSGYFVRLRKP